MTRPSLIEASTGFSPDEFLGMLLGSVVAVVLLAVLLPFAASLILDSVVLVLRGRGIRGLFVAGALTAVTTVTGLIALEAGGSRASTAFSSSAALLLPFSCALAAIAFVVRQVKAASTRRLDGESIASRR